MTALRAEAMLAWLYAVGFGGATIPVAIYLSRRGTLPTFFQLFEMYGGPWWTRFGREAFLRLLAAFFVLTLAVAWVAWLVWNGSTAGILLTLVLLPIEAVFWVGFDLPIPKVIGIARAVLLAVGWVSIS
jgi:hypothetical protein